MTTADELSNLGNISAGQKKFAEAIKYYNRSLVLVPNQYITWNNLGVSYYATGKNQKALDAYHRVLKINPDYPDTLFNIGILYKSQGKYDPATEFIKKTISQSPSHALAHTVLGQIYMDTEKFQQAIIEYRLAISQNPTIIKIYNQIANVYRTIGQFDQAIDYYLTGLTLAPDDTQAWANLAVTYKFAGKVKDSQRSLEKAIATNPSAINLHYFLAENLESQGHLKQALQILNRAIKIDPSYLHLHDLHYEISRKICDWKNLGNTSGLNPFISVLRDEDSQKNLEVAQKLSDQIKSTIPHFPNYIKSKPHPKLRLGFLSRDFRDHPVGHMVASMFKYFDKEKFEVWVFSFGRNDGSKYRKQVEKEAENFVDVSQMRIPHIADLINKKGVDILFDLGGHTEENCLEIFALRPSPIQVTWLGFPGTTGADFFDYIVVDKIIAPPEDQKYYSEKFAYLPHCYQINNDQEQIANHHYTRKDFGLPSKSFIFASFNQNLKIDPIIWKTWMNILQRVPESVLWLWEQEKLASTNLRNEAKKLKIDPNRLIFSGRLATDKHLARMALADLALDTRIYGGHTTTSDMLWAGVPVITKIGKHFASRVCASILTEAGLSELVTTTLEDYEAKAVDLASNPSKLKTLKNKIAHKYLLKNLYNTPRFVQNLCQLTTQFHD